MAALKYRIDSLDDVDEAHRELYRPSGKKFVLDLDGDDGDVGGLKKQVETLLGQLRATKSALDVATGRKERRDADPELADLDEQREAFMHSEAARLRYHELTGEAKDRVHQQIVDAMDQRFMPQYAALKQSRHAAAVTEMTAALKQVLLDHAAGKLAAELAVQGSANVLLPHIAKRLDVALGPSGAAGHKVIVKDAAGQPTDLTVEALAQQFREDPAFAPAIRGADPAAAARRQKVIDAALGRTSGGPRQVTRSQFDGMSTAKRAEFMAASGQVSDS